VKNCGEDRFLKQTFPGKQFTAFQQLLIEKFKKLTINETIVSVQWLEQSW
jgi:hypothetical protein